MKIKYEISETGHQKEQPAKLKNGKWLLCLFIAGQSTKAVTALNNLKTICKGQLKANYHIKVIDLVKNPKAGRDNQILAIPTLMRTYPLPVKQIIGDLSNTERLLMGLGLK